MSTTNYLHALFIYMEFGPLDRRKASVNNFSNIIKCYQRWLDLHRNTFISFAKRKRDCFWILHPHGLDTAHISNLFCMLYHIGTISATKIVDISQRLNPGRNYFTISLFFSARLEYRKYTEMHISINTEAWHSMSCCLINHSRYLLALTFPADWARVFNSASTRPYIVLFSVLLYLKSRY